MARIKDPMAVSLGSRGGRRTVERYGVTQLREWGKLGGRPKKKLPPLDKSERRVYTGIGNLKIS